MGEGSAARLPGVGARPAAVAAATLACPVPPMHAALPRCGSLCTLYPDVPEVPPPCYTTLVPQAAPAGALSLGGNHAGASGAGDHNIAQVGQQAAASGCQWLWRAELTAGAAPPALHVLPCASRSHCLPACRRWPLLAKALAGPTYTPKPSILAPECVALNHTDVSIESCLTVTQASVLPNKPRRTEGLAAQLPMACGMQTRCRLQGLVPRHACHLLCHMLNARLPGPALLHYRLVWT